MIVSNSTLPKGFILKEEYKIIDILGEGGFGITYKAIDIVLNRECVIKEYFPSFAIRNANTTFVAIKSKSDAEVFDWGLKSFFKEAQTLAKFRHPNIVEIYRVFKENGTAYFIMPFEKGVTLEEYISKHELTEKEIISLSIGVLNGLKEAHKHGIIHRDIKPDNIFIKENGLPILIDFGAAKESIGLKSKSLAQILTPGYAPVEQYGKYSFKQGPWTDIYAFGMTLYRIVSGNKDLPTSMDRLLAIASEGEDPLVMPNPGKYSAELLSIIKIMINVKPNERPQSVDEVLKYFKKLVTSTQSPTPPPPPPPLPPEDEKNPGENEKPNDDSKHPKNKRVLLLVGSFIFVVVAAIVIWYMNRKGEIDIYLPSDNLTVKVNDKIINTHEGLNIIKAPIGYAEIKIIGDLYKDYYTTVKVKPDKIVTLEPEANMQIDYSKINTYAKLKEIIVKAVKEKNFNIIKPLVETDEVNSVRENFTYMIRKFSEKNINVNNLNNFKIFFIEKLKLYKIRADNYFAPIILIARDKNDNFVNFFESGIIHYKKNIYIDGLDDDGAVIITPYGDDKKYYKPLKQCLEKGFNNRMCIDSKIDNIIALSQFLKINIDSPEEVYKGYLSLKAAAPNAEVLNQLKEYIKKNFSTSKIPSDDKLISFIKDKSDIEYYLSTGKIIKYYKIYKDDLKKFLNPKKENVKKKILKALGE